MIKSKVFFHFYTIVTSLINILIILIFGENDKIENIFSNFYLGISSSMATSFVSFLLTCKPSLMNFLWFEIVFTVSILFTHIVHLEMLMIQMEKKMNEILWVNFYRIELYVSFFAVSRTQKSKLLFLITITTYLSIRFGLLRDPKWLPYEVLQLVLIALFFYLNEYLQKHPITVKSLAFKLRLFSPRRKTKGPFVGKTESIMFNNNEENSSARDRDEPSIPKSLSFDQQFFHSMFNNISDGIAIISNDNKLMWFNSRLLDLMKINFPNFTRNQEEFSCTEKEKILNYLYSSMKLKTISANRLENFKHVFEVHSKKNMKSPPLNSRTGPNSSSKAKNDDLSMSFPYFKSEVEASQTSLDKATLGGKVGYGVRRQSRVLKPNSALLRLQKTTGGIEESVGSALLTNEIQLVENLKRLADKQSLEELGDSGNSLGNYITRAIKRKESKRGVSFSHRSMGVTELSPPKMKSIRPSFENPKFKQDPNLLNFTKTNFFKMVSMPDKIFHISISFYFGQSYRIIISVRELQNDPLQKLASEFESFKTRTFSSLSHDMKTPLNFSINILDYIQNQVSNFLRENYIEPILNNSRLLLSYVNDILDYSIISSSEQFLVSQVKVELRPFFLDTLSMILFSARERINGVFLEIDQNVPETIVSDPERVRQILLNLLNNAIKFTQQGLIRVLVEAEKEKMGVIKISVKDSGEGISKEKLSSLGLCSKNHDSKLLGLGLTISNLLSIFLAPHDKSGIHVKSKEKQGSSFSFYLKNLTESFSKISSLKESLSSQINKRSDDIPSLDQIEESSPGFEKKGKMCLGEQGQDKPSSSLEPVEENDIKSDSHEEKVILPMKWDERTSTVDLSPFIRAETQKLNRKNKSLFAKLISYVETRGKKKFDVVTNVLDLSKAEFYNEIKNHRDDLNDFKFKFLCVNFIKSRIIKPRFDKYGSSNSLEERNKYEQASFTTEGEAKSLGHDLIKEEMIETESKNRIDSQFKRISNDNHDAFTLGCNATKREFRSSPTIEMDKVEKSDSHLPRDASRDPKRSLIEKRPSFVAGLSVETKKESISPQNENPGNSYKKLKKCSCPDILIVDDQPFNILTLRTMIQKNGIKVTAANSGLEALAAVKEFKDFPQKICKEGTCLGFKLIFMDIDMPVMDGLECTKAIRKLPCHANETKIVACSAFSSEEFKLAARESGMDDYLCKPVKQSDLELVYNKYLYPKFVNEAQNG